MNKTILIITILTTLFLGACTDTQRTNTATTPTTTTADELVESTLTNSDGKTLDMSFNNTKNTVTINLNGETAVLNQERAASGIWYKNDRYELRGKGNDLTLTKDGQVIFQNEEDIVRVEAKSTTGDVLNMTFNNTAGTVKAYLNGGDQIDLVQERAASGIWYKNDQYELRGKGDNYFLTKDGKTVFEN